MDVGRFSKKSLSCVSFPLYFQILSCSTLLQFARVSIPLQAPVSQRQQPIHAVSKYANSCCWYLVERAELGCRATMYAWWVTLEAQGAKNLMGALDTNGYHYPFDQETERQVICDTHTQQPHLRGGGMRHAGNERRLEPISSSETNNSDSALQEQRRSKQPNPARSHHQ